MTAVPIEELHRHALCSILRNNRIAFEDAEDIAQDALLVYLQNQLKVDNPKAYINRVCQNKVADKFRTEAREEKQKEKLAATAEDLCSQAPDEYNEKDIDINDILKIIPRKYHELFLQYKDAGFSQAELARQQGVNYNTLKSKIYTVNTYVKSYYMVREGYMYSRLILNKHRKANLDKLIKNFIYACKTKDPTGLKSFCSAEVYDSLDLDIDIPGYNIQAKIHTKCKNLEKDIFLIAFLYQISNYAKQTTIITKIRFVRNNIKLIKAPWNLKNQTECHVLAIPILNKEFPHWCVRTKDGGIKYNENNFDKKKFMKRIKELAILYPVDSEELSKKLAGRKAIDLLEPE